MSSPTNNAAHGEFHILQEPTTVRYQALTWLTLAAALSYLCRNAVGVAESTIREEMGLTLEQSGWFMGAFFWTYAIFQVPSGWFSQRQGTRIGLTAFALGWSVATLGIGLAPGFWILIVAQLVMGIAQAGIFPASCNSIGFWIPLAQRSLACGILTAGMQVGAIAASSLTGALIVPLGWRWVFALFAVPGFLWAISFFKRFRDRPEQAKQINDSERALIRHGREEENHQRESSPENRTPWFAIIRRPIIWLLCGQQICRAAGYMFFASWFPTFLQETRGVSIKESGYLQGLVLAGTLIGCLLGGIVTDWIWRRTKSLRLSRSGVGASVLGACALLILAAWFVQRSSLAVALLALGALFAALAGPCAFSATIDIGRAHVPQVFGLMNMCGNFAAALSPILIGSFFQWTDNWNLVLLLFALVYFTGAVCWIFINPKHTD
jgi:MFS transporter, ACS family, D-galactonate transporter